MGNDMDLGFMSLKYGPTREIEPMVQPIGVKLDFLFLFCKPNKIAFIAGPYPVRP